MVLDHLVIQKLNADGRLEKRETKKGSNFDKNELSAILIFGAEELSKEDIDEILERAEQVDGKDTGETKHELLVLLRQVANFCNAEADGSFWSRWIKPESVVTAEEALPPSARRVMWILTILTGLAEEKKKDLSLQGIQREVKSAVKLSILFLTLQYYRGHQLN